jgi:glycosyltransferase involved in cell wall biosynthesis
MGNKSMLIVSESFLIGGLETHIRGEIIALTSLGWKVHFACGRRFIDKLLPDCVASVHSNLNLNPDSTISEIIDSIETLREIIIRNNIQIVHAHPFTSLFPAQIAAELENSKFIITLHGLVSLNSYNGPIYDFLLNEVTFKSSSLVVCISEEVKNLAKPHVLDEHLYIQPNAISFPNIINQVTEPYWLVISRLDDDKMPGVFEFILMANKVGLGKILIAGDGSAKQILVDLLIENNLTDSVEFIGYQTDVYDLIGKSKGVAGMERVVLEGLSHQKPVILVGYNGVKGLIDFPLFIKAAKFNFSGRNLENIKPELLSKQLEKINLSEIKTISEYVKEHFEESKMWKKFDNRISQITSNDKSILSDLYHYIFSNLRNNSTTFYQSEAIIGILGKLSQSEKYKNKNLSTSFYNYYSAFIRKVDTYFYHQITELQSKLEAQRIEFINKSNELEEVERKLSHANNLLLISESTYLSNKEHLEDEIQNKNELIESFKVKINELEAQKNQSVEELKMQLIKIEALKNESIEEMKIRLVENEAQKNQTIYELKTHLIKIENQANEFTEQFKNQLSKTESLKEKIKKENEELIIHIKQIEAINEELLNKNKQLNKVQQELFNAKPLKAIMLLRQFRKSE